MSEKNGALDLNKPHKSKSEVVPSGVLTPIRTTNGVLGSYRGIVKFNTPPDIIQTYEALQVFPVRTKVFIRVVLDTLLPKDHEKVWLGGEIESFAEHSSLLERKGILYTLIPTHVLDEFGNTASDEARALLPINWRGHPFRYWVAVMTDLKSATLFITRSTVSMLQLYKSLRIPQDEKAKGVLLAIYPYDVFKRNDGRNAPGTGNHDEPFGVISPDISGSLVFDGPMGGP